MSKNLTRKGLAFGAIVALGSTLLAGAPAQALGLADNSFVSLAPTTGTAYTVLAGAGESFSLSANEASTVVGGHVKFLVSDASGVVESTAGSTGRASFSVDQTSTGETQYLWNTTTDRLTLNVDGTGLAVGDMVSFSVDIADGAAVFVAANTPVAVTAVTSTTSVTFQAVANATATVGTATDLLGADATSEVVREARNTTNNTFVVDSGSASASSSSTVVLSTTESTVVTRSVDVTAWVDSNDNDLVDSTEYASPTRTVKFIKGSEVTATTALDPIIVGSTSVVARVTTVPVLNGQQMSDGDVDAMFTFQGSSVEVDPAAGASVFNEDTDKWDVTAERSFTTSAATVTALVLTVTTSAAHGLLVGETVLLDTVAANNDGTYVIASVPSTTTFTATTASTTAGATEAGTLKVKVVAGSYSARAKIGADYLQAAATSGSAATVTATSGAAAIASSANITTVVTDGSAVATIRPKTLAASATWTFKDTNTAVITAGRPVKVTVTTVTGVTGLKINGTAAVANDVINLTTDASGTVTAALTTTAAVNGNKVILTAVAEGVADTSETATFDWTDGTNTLYDLNATSSVYRSIAKGGAYTFNFAVTDSWKQLVAGDYRLKVATTGNTVSESYPSIATGTASVTVTDAQISSTGDITVVVTAEKKLASGVWTSAASGSDAPAAVTYFLKPVAQSGAKVTAVTADALATFETTSVVAGDSRNSQSAVTVDGTAGTNAVEVTGVVTNALTGVVVSGAAVTVSGTADLLFIDGAKASLGSIVVYADNNGAYSVHVRSNKAAVDTLVTAAALGASSTALKITFLKAKDDTGSALTVTAPATAVSGSTMTVTVSLKDKFGNAVVTDSTATGFVNGTTDPTTKVTYTGPGFVTATIPSVTDADGNIKFVVLLGVNDKGTATVSAAYDSNGPDTNVAGTTLVVAATATITVGAAPVAAAVTSSVAGIKGYVATTVRNASGKAVTVTVNGRVLTPRAPNVAAQLFKFRAKAGKTTVVVKVDGVTVSSRTVMVK